MRGDVQLQEKTLTYECQFFFKKNDLPCAPNNMRWRLFFGFSLYGRVVTV